MKIKEIERRIEEIGVKSGDYEAAHELEDTLYADFIRYIAKSKGRSLQKKARLILKTESMDFPRYTS